jgi:4-hydroxymandelate oxidase
VLINLQDYERAAERCLDPMAWGYLNGGAADERTVGDNQGAWQRLSIRYRTMIDVSRRDLSTAVLGTPVRFPVLVAPTAMQRLAHADGEIAMAVGTQAAGSLLVASTTATTRLEDVAAATPGPKWFQVYVYTSREFTEALVRSAAANGYRALMLTVDVPVLGRRERDIRNAFTLPPGLEIANAVTAGKPAVPGATASASGLMHHFRGLHDSAVTPRDIRWLREVSGLPVVVKGIVRGDDARRAIDAGASAVVVSNHGGRQLDTSVPTAVALPEVVAAVDGQVEVLVDGGIRRGTDVLKAIALGARAALVGRPPLWGLAVDGAAGVQRVLELLRDEFDLAMALAGCRVVSDITADLVHAA